MVKRFVLRVLVVLILGIMLCPQARAISFSDYVYINIKRGNTSSVQKYLNRGYNIDSVNSEGLTPLCQAALENDVAAYNRLIRLGASPQHRCMQRISGQKATLAERNSRWGVASQNVAQQSSASQATVSQTSNNSYYKAAAVAGVLAAGAATAVIVANNSGGGHHHAIVCPDGQKWDGDKCVPIVCPDGQKWDGEKCVPIVCPEGQRPEGDECVPIVCPEGQILDGNECYDKIDCPTGQRQKKDKCVPIECPRNTHLVGNICMANEDVDVEHIGDEDVHIIASDNESVFNLYSSPKYPKAQSDISLHNKGNGNVYGMYAYRGEAFNSYVIGKSGDEYNPEPVGTANITITDEGSGDVYGMYSHISDITQYKEAINAFGYDTGEAHGNINLKHTGGGTTYGLMGDVRAYNTYAVTGGSAYGDISIEGDGDIYGIYGYVAATNALSPFYGHYAKGDINIKSTGDGDIYGMMISKDDIPGAGAGGGSLASWFAFNAYAAGGDVEGTIDIENTGNGNVYGMYGGQQLYNAMAYGSDEEGHPISSAKGLIKINNSGDGDVYGMYLPDEDKDAIVANANSNGSESVIEIRDGGDGVATGIRGGKSVSIVNSGDITIYHDGTSVGIYGEENSKINNSGNIFIGGHDYSTAVGPAYGIYAESGASVVNSGTIRVQADEGAGIYVEKGATLENVGTVEFYGEGDAIVRDGEALDIYGEKAQASAVNLNNLGGGEVVLGQNGQFIAESLAGDMAVSEKVTLGSLENYYVIRDALQANNTDDLSLSSKSALFVADKEKSDKGYDVVLNRKNFNEVIDDKEVAGFLEQNYAQGNNEALYDKLKTAQTTQALNQQAANATGSDIIPGFRQEDALVYQHLSREFNDSLFNRPNDNYIGGYKYIDVSRDKDGVLVGNDGKAHAAYGLIKGKANNGMVYGLGATVSQIKSDYDNNSTRKNNAFGLWAPVGYDFSNGTQWYSKAYAGYLDGSYDRQTAFGKYSSDTKGYQYGLSNELRHNIGLGGGFKFTPAAELNLLGMHQDGFDEGNRQQALKTDDFDSVSLEGGLGAYLSKEYQFNQNHKLGIQIGGIYYVELLDPDEDINARMQGMDGKYKIKHSFDDERAVLSARVNYNYKNITLYGMIEQEFGNYEGLVFDLGLQYNL